MTIQQMRYYAMVGQLQNITQAARCPVHPESGHAVAGTGNGDELVSS